MARVLAIDIEDWDDDTVDQLMLLLVKAKDKQKRRIVDPKAMTEQVFKAHPKKGPPA